MGDIGALTSVAAGDSVEVAVAVKALKLVRQQERQTAQLIDQAAEVISQAQELGKGGRLDVNA